MPAVPFDIDTMLAVMAARDLLTDRVRATQGRDAALLAIQLKHLNQHVEEMQQLMRDELVAALPLRPVLLPVGDAA